LRAVAALAVFATHLGQPSGFTSTSFAGPLLARLNLGVTIFFVISGFLLYRPWVSARLTGKPRPGLGRYALRRATRILPAYWVALTVLGLLLPDLVRGVFSSDWWVYYGLLQVYSPDWVFGGLTVAWSLSTEVAFYAALPLLAYVAVRALGSRSGAQQVTIELAALAASAVAAIVMLEAANQGSWGQTYPNTIAGKWPWFAAGMALAVGSAAEARGITPWFVRSARARPWLWWLGAASVLLVASLEQVLPREVFTMGYRDVMLETVLFAVIAVLFVAPVVYLDAHPRLTPASLLALRPIVWLGTISYGIFLWHHPIVLQAAAHYPEASIAWLGFVSLAITIVCAAGSWYLLERPLMRTVHRRLGERETAAADQAAP
jgi:peptidoglycan/LPS O-acetylase OafA/YrhL